MNEKNLYRLTILSDSHNQRENIAKLLPVINQSDYVIHLGDGSNDLMDFRDEIKCKIICVRGNCDTASLFPAEHILQLGACKFFISHGNSYGVKQSLHRLAQKAESENCNFVLYGHTHVSTIASLGQLTLINPGALSYSGVNVPSYAFVVGNGENFKAQIKLL